MSHPDPRYGSVPIHPSANDIHIHHAMNNTGGQHLQETDSERRRRTNLGKKRICEVADANSRLGVEGLSDRLGIDKDAVRRTPIKSALSLDTSHPKKTGKGRPRYEAIEADLAEWMRKHRDMGYQVQYVHIRQEALRLFAALKASDGAQGIPTRQFKCSSPWITSFKERHGFKDEWPMGPVFHKPMPVDSIDASKAEHANDDAKFFEEEDEEGEDDGDDAYVEYPNPPALHPTRQWYSSQSRRSAGEGSTPTRALATNVGTSLSVFGLTPRDAGSLGRVSGYTDYSPGAYAHTATPESHISGSAGSAHHT